MKSSGNTTVARLSCDEGTAKRVANLLSESLDASDVAIAAFEGADAQWAVEVHFETPPDEPALRRIVATVTGAALTFDTVETKDWVAASLADLKPVIAGRFTVHGAHDRARVAANRIGIEIEAALAFGTGHHGTTRGCLLALDRILKQHGRRRLRVLDIGTGTGVLAIAAARALRAPVLASDIDAEAVHIARENARLNGCAALVQCLHAAGLASARFRARATFDVVFANILLGPLTRLARPMRRALAPGARVVLSGLLAAQENAALAAYRPHGLRLVRRIPLGEWVTLVLHRPHRRLSRRRQRGGMSATSRVRITPPV
jgi:ribosomal protein L11 methyltransferase